mgnify:CR=1 FL=1
MKTEIGLAGKVARAFIGSKLTPLIIIASILLGLGAVVMLPREEEPQIIVPMIDVFVQMPGASAGEIETRVTQPMEKLLWEVPASNMSIRLRRRARPWRLSGFTSARTKKTRLSG